MTSEDEDFAMFFNDLYPSLCRFLECMLGGRSTAQDIAQESFLQLYRTGLGSFPEGEARFWLYRVARNFALNELSKGQTRQRLFEKVADVFRASRAKVLNPEQELEVAERGEILLEMLSTLPEQQRSALLLREQEEMSYREIAAVLSISESKVKVDIFRARNALRERWQKAQRTVTGTSARREI
jgi:RNA polymerase sigma-70 factor (ECF subfamily)